MPWATITRTGTCIPILHLTLKQLQRTLYRGWGTCPKAPRSKRTAAGAPPAQGGVWTGDPPWCCPFSWTPAEQSGCPFILPMPCQELHRQHNCCPATLTALIQNSALHQLLLPLCYPTTTRVIGNSRVKYQIDCVFEGLRKRPTKARMFKALS